MKIYCIFLKVFLKDTSCSNNNGCSNFDKCGTCIDRIKPFLGLSLDNRIYSGLETFVCDSNSRHAKRFPRVKKCLDMVAAWGDYADAFCSKNADTRTKSTTRARVQREINSMSAKQNDLQNTNVWTFINEKDYWLCQDKVTPCGLSLQSKSRIQGNLKRIQSSDLEVEIGSILEEEVRARSHALIRSNMNNFTVSNSSNITKLSKSETRQSTVDFILKLNKKSSDPLQEVPVNVKFQRRKRFSQKTRSTMTNCHDYPRVSQKSSKLRICAHKSVSTEGLTRSTAAKAPNISIPCDPSPLIVQILDVAPTLSDSCLIRTEKFRNRIQNACSCLNNVLRTLDDTEIKNRIDLNLQYSKVPTIQLFLNRAPHQRVQKFAECQTTVDNREKSDISEKQCLKDSEVQDDRCNQKRGGVVFYSPCSNDSLLEEEKVRPRKTVQFDDKVKEKVCENKVSCTGYAREAEFVLSSCFTAPKFQDSVTSEKAVKEVEGDSVPLFANEREGKSRVEQVNVDTRNEIDERKFSKDSSEAKAESYNSTNMSDSCTSDSLKVSNTKQRSQKKNSNIHIHFKRCELGGRTDTSSSFQEDTLEATTPSEARGSDLKPETNVQQGSNSALQKKDSSREWSPIMESKNSALETKCDATGYRRIDLREESGPRKDSLRGIGLETRRSLKEIEKYSDSIGAPNSHFSDTDSDAKCSRCGEDLCSEEAIERVSTCVRTAKKHSSLEMIDTSTLLVTTDVETKVGDGNLPTLPPKCKTSYAANRGTPIHSRYIRPIRVDPSQDPSSKRPDNCQQSLSNRYPERTFAFAATNVRTNRKQNRPKLSTDLGSFSENFCVSSTTPAKSGSPRSRSTLKSKLYSLRFRVPSFKDFQGNRTKETTSETRCKWSHFPDLSRYRNRLWRSSIVPSNFCRSFPANSVSQIKHLLRRKLRRLLLEKDRGTSTSKTFLEDDRYLISVSSGKLIERIVREPCCGSRCPFTARNREKVCGQGETVPERKLAKDTLGDGVRERCRGSKGTEDHGAIGNEPSRFQGRERVYRWCKNEEEFVGDKLEGRKPSCHCGGGPDGRSSVATFGSADLIFVAKNARREQTYLYFDKKAYDKSRESREEKLNRGKCHRKNLEKVKSSKNRKGQFRDAVFEDRGRSFCVYDLGSFEKYSFDIGEDEGSDLAKLFNAYEKRISNLSVDFRLKLSQYVALCRSVKDCLVTRLRADDACEVSSSSV